MNTARTWFFTRFLLGLGAFLGLQALLIGLGVPFLLGLHEEHQTQILTREALKVIQDPSHEPPEDILSAGPFLVYGAQGNLLFSNRGMGRGLPAAARAPVVKDGRTLGWVYNGETAFLHKEANVRFLVTLGQLFLLSLIGSMGIAMVWAAHHGKKIALLFGGLKEDVAQIALGKQAALRSAPFNELEAISQELQVLGRTLSQAEQKQKDFLQDITHDLRTPLAGLRSQLEGMADGVLTATPERIAGLFSETDRMEALINDLSFLFRTEGSLPLKKDQIHLPQLWEDLRFRFEGALSSHSTFWTSQLQITSLSADRLLLQRALSNLVENALSHGAGATRINLGSESSAMGIKIWVEDNGPGVPEDLLNRIFERHFRGDPGRSSKGSGLGLSIVQAIMEKHCGQVVAENNRSGGLKVTLYFPFLRD